MRTLNSKIRVYDNRGRERWVAVGNVIPAGWYNDKCELIEVDHVVVWSFEDSNPYEQYDDSCRYPTLVIKK